MTEAAPLAPSTVLKRPPTTRLRKFRGRLLLANTKTAFELDEVGQFIIARIDGRSSITDIGLAIAGEFDISAELATADASEMLALLVENELVTVVS